MKVFVGALAIFFLCSLNVANAQDKIISGSSYVGCKSKEYYEKLVGYAVQKDMGAFNQGIAAGVATGNCVAFNAGEPVFITDTAIFSGLVKVRRKGKIDEYWTQIEAVK